MKYLITSPLFYLSFSIILFFTLNHFRKLNFLLRGFFYSWFLFSYLLMTSLGANFLVKLVSIGEKNKHCNSRTGVLLANGMMRYTMDDFDFGALSIESLNRMHKAKKWIFSSNENTLLLTGTKANHEIGISKNYLLLLGVPEERLMIDDNSNTTFESAINARNFIAGEKPIILITSPIHMRRSIYSFEKANYLVCPLPSHNQYIKVSGIKTLFPNSYAIIKSEKVIHELIGIAWYWKTNRI